MAQVIKVNVVPVKENKTEKIEIGSNKKYQLLTVFSNGWNRIPKVGEYVQCRKINNPAPLPNRIVVSTKNGAEFGDIFMNDKDVLHGTTMTEEIFSALDSFFKGKVVEIGRSAQYPARNLVMIVTEMPEENQPQDQIYTVVNPKKSIIGKPGYILRAKKEFMSSTECCINVYDENHPVGYIADHRFLATPHSAIITQEEIRKLPNEFDVRIIGYAPYGRQSNTALTVHFLLPNKTENHATEAKTVTEKIDTKSLYTVIDVANFIYWPIFNNGTVLVAKRNAQGTYFDVWTETVRVGSISILKELLMDGTKHMTKEEAQNLPDEFKVQVVDSGFLGKNKDICGLIVKMIPENCPQNHNPNTVQSAKATQVSEVDKKILKKYLAYLLNEGCCTTDDLMKLSEAGLKKKAMLDARYKEIMRVSVEKLKAYFELL